MAEKKDIVCPCGNLLGTNSNTSGGGTKFCNKCKNMVKYTVKKDRIDTSYK